MSELNMPYKKPRGFTITELLIAILIIAVLTIIAFSLNQKVMAQSAEAKCVANLRGYGTAIITYVTEYGFFMKPGYQSGNNAALWNYNLNQSGLLPFTEQRRLYCPKLYRSEAMLGGVPESQWVTNGYVNGVGYVYNAWLAGKRPSNVAEPSGTMLLMEGLLEGRVASGSNHEKLAYRHEGTMNVIFCDGSIKKGLRANELPNATDRFWAYPRLPLN